MNDYWFCSECTQIATPKPTVSYDKRCPNCNSKLEMVTMYSDAELAALTDRNRDLEQTVRELCGDGPDIISYDNKNYWCFFCEHDYTRDQAFALQNFRCTNPTCPTVKARALVEPVADVPDGEPMEEPK